MKITETMRPLGLNDRTMSTDANKRWGQNGMNTHHGILFLPSHYSNWFAYDQVYKHKY